MKYSDEIGKLNKLSYKVTQEGYTEKPFDNEYYNEFSDGIYVDVVSGEVLFSSEDKYDSGCGWPSFSKPIDNQVIVEVEDYAHNLKRIEVKSQDANSHLGHVFQDGPEMLGGLRYCINSAAIRFIHKENLVKEGFAEYLQIFEGKNEDK